MCKRNKQTSFSKNRGRAVSQYCVEVLITIQINKFANKTMLTDKVNKKKL